jgi:hypothetical protein
MEVAMEQVVRRKGKTSGASTPGAPPIDPQVLYQQIAERAYQRFLERNRFHGHDLEDWLEAERTVLAESGAKRKGRA